MTSAHDEGGHPYFPQCVSLARAGYEVYMVERERPGENEQYAHRGRGGPARSRRKRMTERRPEGLRGGRAETRIYTTSMPGLISYGAETEKRPARRSSLTAMRSIRIGLP